MNKSTKEFLHYFNRTESFQLTPIYKVHKKEDPRLVDLRYGNNRLQEIELNMEALEKAIADFVIPGQGNREVLLSSEGESWSYTDEDELLFLLNSHPDEKDNKYVHDVPHYIMLTLHQRLFFDFSEARQYAAYLKKESLVYFIKNGKLTPVQFN